MLEVVRQCMQRQDTLLTVDISISLCRAFKSLCVPYNAEDLQWYPVDPKMNNSRVDGPEVSQPLKRQPITAFFKSRGQLHL